MRIVAILKLINLILKGNSFQTSLFFSNWVGGGNSAICKKFEVSHRTIKHISTGKYINISKAHIFRSDIYLLEKYFMEFNLREQDKELIISCQKNGVSVNVCVETFTDLAIHREIFLEDTYGLDFPFDAIIVDIGMNIGMASLYFATMPAVKKVYGYEIIPKTFKRAQLNFAINNQLAKKISPHCFGIGSVEKFVSEASIKGESVFASATNATSVETGRIEIKSVIAVIDQIRSANSGIPLILKIDCEGGEYEILKALEEENKLNLIAGIVIEWHDGGPKSLIESLVKNNFGIYHYRNPHYPSSLGMISAWKIK